MSGAAPSGLSEFDLIARYLKPLSAGAPGAFALTDDAAVLPDPAPGAVHVVTKDALAVGVHMRREDGPSAMARKALRVNLSDLAAMGATPVGFFMALCLGQETKDIFVAAFAEGLAADVAEFSMPLMGGDIIRTAGPLTVTITALGSVPEATVLKRSGGQPGDSLWVSGTIGDGALGLLASQGDLPDLTEEDQAALVRRYQIPQPRLSLGQQLAGIATACIDISDGLVADVTHLCTASKLGCRIRADDIPLSDPAKQALVHDPDILQVVLNGGDDYELAWAVPPELDGTVPPVASAADVAVSRIGQLTESGDVEIVDETGSRLDIANEGYRHV